MSHLTSYLVQNILYMEFCSNLCLQFVHGFPISRLIHMYLQLNNLCHSVRIEPSAPVSSSSNKSKIIAAQLQSIHQEPRSAPLRRNAEVAHRNDYIPSSKCFNCLYRCQSSTRRCREVGWSHESSTLQNRWVLLGSLWARHNSTQLGFHSLTQVSEWSLRLGLD